MSKTRVGIIGLGNIGVAHVAGVKSSAELEVAGITDVSRELREKRAAEHDVPAFAGHIELIEQARPDYVAICTPHFSHVKIAVEAMKRGVHAFIEKPLAVSVSDADECARVSSETGCLVGVNFLRRKMEHYQKMRELIHSGFVGRITRVTLLYTNWFRSMAYYRSSPWRATWDGEGGGIIVNQSPHDLDFVNWAIGLPVEVYAEINTLGHDIAVEDDVMALLKWENGSTGTLHVTTNEAPGRSVVEVAGTKGTLQLNGTTITATALAQDTREYSDTTATLFGGPAVASTKTHDFSNSEWNFCDMHVNFARAIRGEEKLICSLEDGIKEVEFANALLISGVKRKWVRTPVIRAEFDEVLAKLIETKSLNAAKEFYQHNLTAKDAKNGINKTPSLRTK